MSFLCANWSGHFGGFDGWCVMKEAVDVQCNPISGKAVDYIVAAYSANNIIVCREPFKKPTRAV